MKTEIYMLYSTLAVPATGILVKGWRKMKNFARSGYDVLAQADIDSLDKEGLRNLRTETARVGILYDLLPLTDRREILGCIDGITKRIDSKLERS